MYLSLKLAYETMNESGCRRNVSIDYSSSRDRERERERKMNVMLLRGLRD